MYDLVFEGTYAGYDTIRSGYYANRGIMLRFEVDRIFRGFELSRSTGMVEFHAPRLTPGTRVLGYVMRGCDIDGWACGNFYVLGLDRHLQMLSVDTEWKRDSLLLSADTLEQDIENFPDSQQPEGFGSVSAIALARLKNPRPTTFRGRELGGFPSGGGIWEIVDPRWILGRPPSAPKYVRFEKAPSDSREWRFMSTEVQEPDRFLVPVSNPSADTIVTGLYWRPMLVRQNQCVGFGVPPDSLATFYQKKGNRYQLRQDIAGNK